MLKQKLTATLFIILMLASISALSGCFSTSQPADDSLSGDNKATEHANDYDDDIKEFVSFIESGSYTDAIVKYNTDIVGNTHLETEAAEYIKSYLEDIETGVLSGEYDETEANIMTTTVEKVYTSTNCTVDGYNELTQNIKEAVASKAAYKSGLALLDSQNYIDAIAEFEKVIPSDADYRDAIEKRELAIDTYKNDCINKATELVGEGDYLSAIAVLKDAVNSLEDDVDLLAELNTCERNYIAGEIQRAEEVFVDYTKYEEALAIVRSVLQYYPDNEYLLEKVDYYNSFAPINLFDMSALRGAADMKETDIDSYGNEHEKSFWSGYSGMIWCKTDITFNLDGFYNTFTATIYGRSVKNDTQYMQVYIYADDNVIYEDLSIPDNKTAPFEINLDVTGVRELRIVLGRTNGAIGGGIGMTDMIIQRTEK